MLAPILRDWKSGRGFKAIIWAGFLLAGFFCAGGLMAQSRRGITGKPDTSYTSYSAWLSLRKSYPDLTLVTRSNPPSIRTEMNISYTKADDRELDLDVFYPLKKSVNKQVGVLIIHGGGWRSGNRTQHYPLAERLAKRGYTCFTPEYRLSTEALFPAAVFDIKAAIRWVRSHAGLYGIDPGRIAVLGFSAGGELAAFMGTTGNIPLFEGIAQMNDSVSSAVQAVVDIDGILAFIHPESREGDDNRHVSAATYWFGCSRSANPGLWTAGSPLTYAGASSPPTLFLNSSVKAMHAGRDDYIRILQKHGIYSEVHEFDKAPHSFCLFEPWFDPTVHYIDKFLSRIFTESR